MNTNRRAFIRNGALLVAGTAVFPSFKPLPKQRILGIQLYAVRDDMKADPTGTLKKLAKMGYKYVEHAGYAKRKFYGYSIGDFKKLLADNGLHMPSGHHFFGAKQWDNSTKDFTQDWKYAIEDAAAVGMKYVISPGIDESLCKSEDDFKNYMHWMNKSGELCKKSGISFAYHNESYEFNHQLDNTVIYDLLLKLTDPKLVEQQIDIGNMWETGGRPMDYLKRYPGRFKLMHVKDEIKRELPGPNGEHFESTILGKGILHVKEVVNAAKAAGVKYYILEQESYQDKTPLQSAEEDLQILSRWI